MEHELRVVVVGKTGVGKSTLGNTLFCSTDAFKTAVSEGPCTQKCEWKVGKQFNTTIEITDTVGALDLEEDEGKVFAKIATSITESSPGPHIVLYVVDCGRLSKEDWKLFKTLKKLFTEEICKYVIVVFNKIDHYNKAKESATVDELRYRLEVQLHDPAIQETKIPQLLQEAGQRHIGIHNVASDSVRRAQARSLYEKMKELKEQNGGEYYKSVDMLPRVRRNLQTIMQRPPSGDSISILQEHFKDKLGYSETALRGAKRVNNKCVIM